MFLALRDIAHARGRFALIGTVIALVTLLLVMLTGLTGGLSQRNTSALDALEPERVVFAGAPAGEEPKIDFAESHVDESTERAWREVTDATPLGAGQTRADMSGQATAVAVFGLPAGTEVPGGTVPESGALIPDELGSGELVLGGQDVAVSGTVPTEYYSHLPVVWTDMTTWREVTHSDEPTVLLADAPSDDVADKVAHQTGSTAVTLRDSYDGLAAYRSERGSLVTMQALLYGISALVIVAFLSVWTIQRTRDIAVLRALGASRGYVLRDALAQAGAVVLAGAVGGGLVGWGLGALAAGAVPFELTLATVAGPVVGVVVLGLIGAVVATRRVARVDPQLALNA